MKIKALIPFLLFLWVGLNAQKNTDASIPITPEINKTWESQSNKSQSPQQWTFKHKSRKKTRIINKGQQIKVRFQNPKGRNTKLRGKFDSFAKDEMIMESDEQGLISIQRSKIEKITVYNQKASLFRSLGGMVMAIILLVGGIVFMNNRILTFDTPTGSTDNQKGKAKKACFSSMILLAGTTVLMLSLSSKKIKTPFGGDWELTETVQNPDNQKGSFEDYKDKP